MVKTHTCRMFNDDKKFTPPAVTPNNPPLPSRFVRISQNGKVFTFKPLSVFATTTEEGRFSGKEDTITEEVQAECDFRDDDNEECLFEDEETTDEETTDEETTDDETTDEETTDDETTDEETTDDETTDEETTEEEDCDEESLFEDEELPDVSASFELALDNCKHRMRNFKHRRTSASRVSKPFQKKKHIKMQASSKYVQCAVLCNALKRQFPEGEEIAGRLLVKGFEL